jgi:hypothetical protein
MNLTLVSHPAYAISLVLSTVWKRIKWWFHFLNFLTNFSEFHWKKAFNFGCFTK